MAKKGVNISLSSYDDIFTTEETRNDKKLEKVQNIPLSELHPFKNHPFKVIDDESMLRTVESVAQYGVLAPAIARPREEGGYELVSGHRRHHASELAGLETMPVIVRNLDDDAAVILMVDSNLQRETILPSERAFAYKMKKDAVERSLGRPKNVGQVVPDYFGKRTTEIIGEGTGESYKQVQRYIRLTELIPELLSMVDEKKISFNPAVELSFLKPEEQKYFLEAMDMEQNVPSLSQAQRIKKLSQDGNCTIDTIQEIMAEVKKSELDKVTIKNDVLKKYFPKSYTPKQMQDTIIKLLEGWHKKRQQQMER
ncbi:ParB/RepB/Spo0J family partition protein [Thomasclavelia ramosa]|uniref:ParB/RepB/Spo0J family partition protein n=1 Tax=Thomasclavelia ramosa TaxID=1547 RepID=UPI003DA3E5F5